jgi:hypothetical protein
MNYIRLSLPEVSAGLAAVADDAHRIFGSLEEQKLNWKPDEKQWSVAQCFDHLINANDLLVRQAKSALANQPSSIWQRLPVWPAMFGRLMVSSQGPRKPSSTKYTADPQATPASRISPDVIKRFVDQHRALETWTRSLDEPTAARTILVSPFVRFITYSVLDGLRLVVAHDRRHFEQARRVLQASPR